jgi:hypothetical protein
MIDWQDIATAPKDGTEILLYVEDVAIEAVWDSSLGRRFWRVGSVTSHGCGCCSSNDDDPTHWAALNKPPQKEGE